MLLVGRLKASVPPISCHRGIRVGDAYLLMLARLAAVSLCRCAILVGVRDGIDMADSQALPAHVRPDQRGIDMHDLALCDLRRHAGLHSSLEDAPETLGTPALADAG